MTISKRSSLKLREPSPTSSKFCSSKWVRAAAWNESTSFPVKPTKRFHATSDCSACFNFELLASCNCCEPLTEKCGAASSKRPHSFCAQLHETNKNTLLQVLSAGLASRGKSPARSGTLRVLHLWKNFPHGAQQSAPGKACIRRKVGVRHLADGCNWLSMAKLLCGPPLGSHVVTALRLESHSIKAGTSSASPVPGHISNF